MLIVFDDYGLVTVVMVMMMMMANHDGVGLRRHRIGYSEPKRSQSRKSESEFTHCIPPKGFLT